MANAAIILTATDKTQAAFNNAQRNLDALTGAASRFNAALAGVGLGVSLQAIGQMADDYASLQARLKLASRSAEEFAAANEAVQRIAAASSAPLLETATLYTRIASSLKDTSVSQAEMVGTTEAVALSLRISGASAVEASSAMLQFSQAVASGVLRGDEFNAVNESAPRLMQALAKSLGVSVGALRDMAKEGQLTRDVLIDGLARQLPELRREAESLPKTLGATFTDLNNTLLSTIGRINEASGASGTLAKAFSDVGNPLIIKTLETLGVVAANTSFVFKTLANDAVSSLTAIGYAMTLQFGMAKKTLDLSAAYAKSERTKLDELEKKIFGGEKKTQTELPANGVKEIGPISNELKKRLEKSLNPDILEKFATGFKDMRLKIQAEYAALVQTFDQSANGEASGLGVTSAIVGARSAISGGDGAGAAASIAAGKAQLSDLAKSGAPRFELDYLARQLKEVELAAVDVAEKAATSARDALSRGIGDLSANISKVKQPELVLNTDLLAKQIKQAVADAQAELSANPLAVPVVYVPKVSESGGLSVDLSRAASKLGAR